MKKLGLSLIAAAAFLISTNDIQAQATDMEEEIVEVEQEQQTDDFQTIEIMALPQAVKVAVIKDFEGATTEEAWVKTDDEGKKVYKIAINVDGESKNVVADADGKWIEEKQE
ncbi:hypothetical protein RM545_09410 [Zunongwangia sp. F260]|uniref:PepSY domain-containing protein n=1 Tax=Autumnicola lenta TaxID=3075593 RepID=A0ABU3CKN0_9FLAO|nr:hypothetical protein [Zunongwangia sp. F260]MDT0646909.1 hypothetical protein [Zunongwangia sp. F260]